MRIMKKLLSVAMMVAMLATSTVAFGAVAPPPEGYPLPEEGYKDWIYTFNWQDGLEPLYTETLTVTKFTTEEAIELYQDEAAVTGCNIALTNTRGSAVGMTINMKIPTGFSLAVNTGSNKKPVWEYIELTKANAKQYMIDWAILGDASVDDVGLSDQDGDDYFGVNIKVYSATFYESETFIQIFLCDEDGEYTLPDDAFEITASQLCYSPKDNAFPPIIVNAHMNTEPEVTYPEDGSEAVEVGSNTYKCWTFADQNVADFYNSGGKTIELSLYEDDAVSETKEQKVFLPEDPGSGTFTFKVYASISDVYKKVTCKIK